MKRFFTARNLKRLGRWCKAGAWSIAALGILYLCSYSFFIWNTYTNYSHSTSGYGTFSVLDTQILVYVANTCTALIFALFNFIVLFVAGTIFTGMAATTQPAVEESEDIVYEALEKPIKVSK